MTFARLCVSDYAKCRSDSQCSVEVVSNERVWSCSHGEVAAACIHQDVQLQNTQFA